MPSRIPFEQPEQHVFDRIMDRCIIDPDTGCWNWPGATGNGYGRIISRGRLRYVHRLVYGAYYGRIPDGLVIDHLCRNRLCCNPEHLEAVTDGENSNRGARVALKTHCARGHEWKPENWYVRPDGRKWCRPCQLERMQRRAS